VDNIPRILPAKVDAVVHKGTWEVLPIFQLLANRGGIPEPELYQVFNMGIGMVAVVSSKAADAVLAFMRARKHTAWKIGEITPGRRRARVV
jgi:phosphoribosylformylglycinamidine cyclo-ligase